MARKLRIQYPGALYHVINRGNYRHDIFGSAGAAQAFETALGEACSRFTWRIHAYVIMRNHYHFALETPEANLVEGMHWLQSTFATRFNRRRAEHGHLFQGRYQALLVENPVILARVVHYIHLNPVRARIVGPAMVDAFRWSSLRRYVRPARPSWLTAEAFLGALHLTDTGAGWRAYREFLATLADDTQRQKEMGFATMSRGWAIGTLGWRRALAREYSALRLEAGFEREQLNELKETRWSDCLAEILRERGESIAALDFANRAWPWKIHVAVELRRRVAAPYAWIARELKIKSSASLRMQVCRRALHVSA